MIDNLKSRVSLLILEKKSLTSSEREEEVANRLLKKDIEIEKCCMMLLDHIAKNKLSSIFEIFEETVSSGLKDIFDESYEFKIAQKERKNTSSVDFLIHCSVFPGWSDIVMCHGKSLQDVISILLRIILVKLDDKSRKIIVLDEPTSGVEIERQRIVSKLLSEICIKFGIQLIVVTHSEELCFHAEKVEKING
jgi:predicted ATPase